MGADKGRDSRQNTQEGKIINAIAPMNHKLLICLGVSTNDGPLAERLLDFIYKQNGKRAIGHLLIVANSDLHEELRMKLRVTAELAFESVTEAVAPAVDVKFANSKFHQLNNLFRHAAKTTQDQCRWPWFWLEPDCVPVASNWIAQLADAYDSQPKKYMGLIAKGADGKKFMARCGIYYGAASYELDSLCQSDVPFPLATAGKVIPCAAATELIDYLNIETPEDLANISKSAVVVHGDKMGLFAENWRTPIDINLEIDTEMVERFLKMPEEELRKHKMNERQRRMFMERVSKPVPPMQPQEIAKEINEFLKEPVAEAPRLTRRQIREAEQAAKSAKLDCVATNGCKSSTEVVTL